MKKFFNLDTTVFGSILLSNFVSGGVVTMEKTVAPAENIEDRFIGHFRGNAVFYNGGWTKRILDLGYEGNLETKLAEFCARAHKAAGLGDSKVNIVAVNPSILIFDNQKYTSKNILVVIYGLEDPWHEHDYQGHHYRYVTKGTRQDCVFYLELVNPGLYKLQREVCGIAPVL